jgi:hypothetical protein
VVDRLVYGQHYPLRWSNILRRSLEVEVKRDTELVDHTLNMAADSLGADTRYEERNTMAGQTWGAQRWCTCCSYVAQLIQHQQEGIQPDSRHYRDWLG